MGLVPQSNSAVRSARWYYSTFQQFDPAIGASQIRQLLPVVLASAALGTVVAIPSASVAQEPQEPVKAACNAYAEFSGVEAAFVIRYCSGDASGAKTLHTIRVTYSVTESTRAKYKLPSRTIVTGTLSSKSQGPFQLLPSRAMRAALKKLRGEPKFTVTVKAKYTEPVTETVTDSFVMKSTGYNSGLITSGPEANLSTRYARTNKTG